MIELHDVIKKIAEMLSKEFKMDVWDSDTQEGFKPECFYVVPVVPHTERMGEGYFHDVFSVRVTFFPVDEHQLNRLLEVKTRLRDLFVDGIFVTNEFHIDTQDMQFDFTPNHNLELLMDFETWQRRPEAEGPLLEELETNFKEE